MTSSTRTISDGYAEAGADPDAARLESIASAWTPGKQAEYAQLQKLADSGQQLSPRLTMQLGYLQEAKNAYDQTHGK